MTAAFENLVTLDQNLADAGESRQYIDLIWGAVLTRYLTLARFGGFGNVRSAGRVQTPTLALVVERERERMAFVPEDYWQIRGFAAKGEDEFKIAHATARFTDKTAAETAFSTRQGRHDGHRHAGDSPLPQAAAAHSVQHHEPPSGSRRRGHLAGAHHAHRRRASTMAGLISYPRVDNTVYPRTLDFAGVVRAWRTPTRRSAPLPPRSSPGR